MRALTTHQIMNNYRNRVAAIQQAGDITKLVEVEVFPADFTTAINLEVAKSCLKSWFVASRY